MNVKLESKVLEDAIKVMMKLAPPANGLITLDANKGLTLHSTGELNKGRIKVPVTVDGTANFSVAVDALLAAIRGRKELELSFTNAMLHIKSGRYKAELSTFDSLSDEERVQERKVKGTDIDNEMGAWLKNAVKNVTLAPDPLLMTYMPLGIKSTSKGTNVCCFDTTHMSVLGSKEIKGDLADFVIPVHIFTNVLDVFAVSPFTIELTESMLRCSNKTTLVELALPVLDDTLPSVDDVLNKARAAQKAKSNTLEVSKAEFTNFFANAKAIAGKERTEVKVKVAKGRMTLTSSNINGSVNAQSKVKSKDLAFSINMPYLEEAVTKADDTVQINVVDGAFITCVTPRATFVIATNQED